MILSGGGNVPSLISFQIVVRDLPPRAFMTAMMVRSSSGISAGELGVGIAGCGVVFMIGVRLLLNTNT